MSNANSGDPKLGKEPDSARKAHEPHKPHKFDPARAARLEDPDRQRFMPNDYLLGLLALSGSETVVDYGAGSGVISIELARALPRGEVHAIEENREMFELLEDKLSGAGLHNIHTHEISDNRVSLPDGSADRVLAVNLLHEIVGENALQEMRRLLKPEGTLLVVDWRADVDREEGPPTHVTFDIEGAREIVEKAGFTVETVGGDELPYHLALRASPAG